MIKKQKYTNPNVEVDELDELLQGDCVRLQLSIDVEHLKQIRVVFDLGILKHNMKSHFERVLNVNNDNENSQSVKLMKTASYHLEVPSFLADE